MTKDEAISAVNQYPQFRLLRQHNNSSAYGLQLPNGHETYDTASIDTLVHSQQLSVPMWSQKKGWFEQEKYAAPGGIRRALIDLIAEFIEMTNHRVNVIDWTRDQRIIKTILGYYDFDRDVPEETMTKELGPPRQPASYKVYDDLFTDEFYVYYSAIVICALDGIKRMLTDFAIVNVP